MSLETAPAAEVIDETYIGEIDLHELNKQLADLSPQARIARANEIFAGGLVLPTTFGPTAPVLLKYATDVIPDIPVVTIRHGFETGRTTELTDWYQQVFNLNLKTYEAPKLKIPEEDTPEFSEFQRQIKVEPFQRMLDDFLPKAYFSGVMRWQTQRRQNLPYVERKGAVLAINPVLDLSEDQVADFFEQTGLPKNDNYFDPTKGSSQKNECQLNTTAWEAKA